MFQRPVPTVFLLFVLCLSFANASAQTLIQATPLGQKSKAQLLAQFNNLPLIQYGAQYYRITYTSPDVRGVMDTVTGLLAVPDNPNRVYPRLVYQHGTSGSRTEVPSLNYANGEGQVGLLFAGLGYIALLPDYLGLGNVSRGFHPYVHADSEAWVAQDMLEAVKTYCNQQQIAFNDQLFITGYSQGGHAAMALHRAIETDPAGEMTVTAAAHLSGPYSISGVMRDLILSDDIYYYPGYLPNTALSYQTVYGNLFDSIPQIFRAPYAGMIQSFYEGATSLSQLNEWLIETLTVEEGACRPFRMLQPNLVQAVISDPQHPVNLALADNDTYDQWTPQAPMRIFYCMNDDQVPFQNSILVRDTFQAAGVPNFLADDVMPSANHGECYVPAVTSTVIFFFLGFQQVGTVGTSTADDQVSLKVWPAPADREVVIEAPLSNGVLEILDLRGNVRYTAASFQGQSTVSVGGLEPGWYVVRWTMNGRTLHSKLLIQR